MRGRRSDRHVYPAVLVAHETSGTACWCNPRVEMICPECEDARVPSCWRCSGAGWVECATPDAYDGPVGLCIVHHNVPRHAA